MSLEYRYVYIPTLNKYIVEIFDIIKSTKL